MDDLKPVAKKKSWKFWMDIEFDLPQFLGEPGWIEFGFCTCNTENENVHLMALYKGLMTKCAFNDFREALETSSLSSPFARRGLKPQTHIFRYFRSVMDNSKALPLVWYLKSFVYTTAGWLNIPHNMRAVAINYGFQQCRSAADRVRLSKCIVISSTLRSMNLTYIEPVWRGE